MNWDTAPWETNVDGLNDRLHKLELLLLRIEAYGPGVILETPAYLRLLRWTAANDWHACNQIKGLLMAKGMNSGQVQDLLDEPHKFECACWRCLVRSYKGTFAMVDRWKKRSASNGQLDTKPWPGTS